MIVVISLLFLLSKFCCQNNIISACRKRKYLRWRCVKTLDRCDLTIFSLSIVQKHLNWSIFGSINSCLCGQCKSFKANESLWPNFLAKRSRKNQRKSWKCKMHENAWVKLLVIMISLLFFLSNFCFESNIVSACR